MSAHETLLFALCMSPAAILSGVAAIHQDRHALRAMFLFSNRKVGGIRFIRLGRLCLSFSVSRHHA
jgi:hypothetical protein